jgi:hypothetical protein
MTFQTSYLKWQVNTQRDLDAALPANTGHETGKARPPLDHPIVDRRSHTSVTPSHTQSHTVA